KMTLNEKEFFSSKSPEIATAVNKVERTKLIEKLRNSNDDSPERLLFKEFLNAKRILEVSASYAHDASRFPLIGKGIVNLYGLFSETTINIISKNGRAGLVTPSGLATDVSMSALFSFLVRKKMLVSFYSFENKRRLFRDVQPLLKFALVTFGNADQIEFAFMLHGVNGLLTPGRIVRLSSDDIALLNPNTLTAPILRSQKDFELVADIYRRIPILYVNKTDSRVEENSWGVDYRTLYNMTSDAHAFFAQEAPGLLPLYESKLFQIYDHRFTTFDISHGTGSIQDDDSAIDVSNELKADVEYNISTRYWVSRREVSRMLIRLPKYFYLDDERIRIAALVAYLQYCLGHDIDLAPYLPWVEFTTEIDFEILTAVKSMKKLSHVVLVQFKNTANFTESLDLLLELLTPSWMYGWRRVTDMNANLRTLIPSVFPLSGGRKN
ncbi:MAG: hypothetical protein EBS00_00440, partial [Verrucomicrobia bacterium]|nr:hypothetical protein [Verrucomicrobiota bacterium]